jgi:CDP-glucose 4,6-dehydratase
MATKKRILITGATGLVGSWATRHLLNAEHEVVVLVSDMDYQSELFRTGLHLDVTIFNGRLERYEDVERTINNGAVNQILHLGAQPIVGVARKSPRHTFESNIQGTWNILDASRIIGDIEAIVVASSDKAYGSSTNLPYLESHPLQGDQPYEVSKSCTDLITRTYAVTYGLSTAIARCGNIFGGGDLNWNRIIPGTYKALWDGDQPIIRSDGSLVRDYIYVEDVARAYSTLLEALASGEVETGEAFNFSDESPMSVLDVYKAVCRSWDGNETDAILLGQASDEIPAQYLDSKKAKEILGWKPAFSLSEGLARTAEWYRKFFESSKGHR